MKYKLLTLAASAIVCALLSVSCGKGSDAEPAVPEPDMLSQLQRVSKLELTQYKIHVITKYEDKGSQLKGSILGIDYNLHLPTGERKIAIPIDATVHAYIDMSDFSEQNVTYQDDKVIITLPDPRIEILHTKVRNDEITTGVSMLRSNFSDEEITRFQRMGRDSIESNIRSMGFVERARKQAASVLIPIIRQTGFGDDQIKIEFSKTLNDNNLRFYYNIQDQ